MKFTILTIIPNASNATKTFSLHIKCRIGDDNKNTTKVHDYKSTDEQILKYHFDFLSNFIEHDMGDARKLTKQATDVANMLHTIRSGPDLLNMLVPRDHKYVSMLATIIAIWITYFDEDGHEHFVEVSRED